jgi:catechol 2,3-dioxygenase-like lactoylglutathione lyase family enzyme
VRDLDRSITFYCGLLGFTLRMRGESSAYLEAGALWLALVVDANVRQGPSPEYSHMAFTVAASSLDSVANQLKHAGVVRWREPDHANSFYFLDPDGHKLELHSGDLRSRLRARAAFHTPGTTIYERNQR